MTFSLAVTFLKTNSSPRGIIPGLLLFPRRVNDFPEFEVPELKSMSFHSTKYISGKNVNQINKILP